MEQIAKGVARFQRTKAPQFRELFARLAREGQHPRALFITCADSRVTPDLLTDSQPGDLFIIKNIGNIVPPVDSASHSVAATIEYAVNVLRVPDIIVCGHTQCGAMHALLDGLPAAPPMPHLRQWLDQGASLLDRVPVTVTDRLTALAEENVRIALRNLAGYPAVAECLAAGALRLHGWMFSIATMKMSALDAATGEFRPLLDEK
ncbi:MAG: carbonic anhydrase [Verrucomicrobia bacterium]|nr:carbonic anhydrase [Verrucomicrobiota bacterium]